MTIVWNLDEVVGVGVVVTAVVSLAGGVVLVLVGHLMDRRRARRRGADAVAAARAARGPVFAPGVQPACEFTNGPRGHGLLFRDELLAEVVDAWSRELGGGVR